MARFSDSVNNFKAGEISPKLKGRTDIPVYKAGLEELTNAYPKLTGGLTRRPGSVYVSKTFLGDGTEATRLIPFVFSQNESYVLEAKSNTDYFYGRNVTSGQAIIMNPSSNIDTTPSIGYSQYLSSWDGWDAQYLNEVQYAQVGDVLILVHPSKPPVAIARIGENLFEVFTYSAIGTKVATSSMIHERVPYRSVNITTTTLSSSTPVGGDTTAAGGLFTVTASTPVFNSLHVGSVWRMATGYFAVVSYTSSTVVRARNIHPSVAVPGGPTTDWAEGAWSDYRGWPRSVTYYQDRLYFAGTASNPDTIWMSKTFNILKFLQGTSADDPASFSISTSPQVNEIQWMSVNQSLAIGTLGAEYSVVGSDSALRMGPTNPPDWKPNTTHGSSYIQAKRMETGVIFVQRNASKIQEITFDFYEGQYKTQEMTLLADHMVRKQHEIINSALSESPLYIDIAYQGSTSVIWCIDKNGGLSGFTRDKNGDSVGFHFHMLGGSNKLLGVTDIPPKVKSICVVPNANHNNDELFMVVERYIDGAYVYYVEHLNVEHDFHYVKSSAVNVAFQPVYSDSAKLVSMLVAGESNAFNGFEHLVGEEVVLLGDGKYLGTATVSDSTTNMFVNGNAEIASVPSEMFVYNDYAATPVYGYGGTTNITIANSAVAPISGTRSFVLSKDAVNRQGEGLSFDFTIPSGDRGKAHQIEFDFLQSAGYVANDVKVYLFDKVNFNYIEFAYVASGASVNTGLNSVGTSFNMGASLVSDRARIVFKSKANSNQYRLIMHIASTNAVAYDVKLDLFTVTNNGCIALPANVGLLIAGLNYESTIKTLPLDAGSLIGSAQGAPKLTDRTVIRFYRTVGAKFGRDEDDLEPIIFRPSDISMDDPIPLFTGDKVVDGRSTWDRSQQIIVKQDIPLPMNVLAIIRRGVTND